MRALQLGQTSAASAGGADRYYFELMHALPACGVSVTGLVSGDSPLTGTDGVTSFSPGGTSLLERWWSLRGSVHKRLAGCDVVVCHFAAYAFPVLDIIRKRPMVIHFHGSWSLEAACEGSSALSTTAKRAIELAVYSRSSHYIALSNAASEVLERKYGVPKSRISVIPGGVNLERFQELRSRAEVRAALGWPIDRPTVLTVCRLVQIKGVDNLISAINSVRRVVPDVLLVIAGVGPARETLMSQVNELGLSDHVRFIGHVDAELPSVYRAANLLIVPSTALETFGLVVIESLACGTPALVTPVSGLPEVVQGLEPGLILSGTSPAALAEGIIGGLNSHRRLPSSDECRAYAAKFAWPAIAKKIASVYREVA
jgi:glycogen(starch) synthase